MASVSRRFGLALDIDGVFLRGSRVLDAAIPALRRIRENKIAHCFVTNGGGITEESKAHHLSHQLQSEILPSQVLLSHTPMQKLAELYHDKKILVIGSKNYLEVASSYGFKNVVTAQQIHCGLASVFPGRAVHTSNYSDEVKANASHDQDIAAALILYDPIDWALEIQVLTDVLLGSTNNTANMQQLIPLYACNADIVYMDSYQYPRYTQGAFIHAFQALFETYSKLKLDISICGKPYLLQYETAESMIQAYARKLALEDGAPEDAYIPEYYYGIGDNPKADIRGANNAGAHWGSILVRTGVHQSEENDVHDPADIITDDIGTALDIILAKHMA